MSLFIFSDGGDYYNVLVRELGMIEVNERNRVVDLKLIDVFSVDDKSSLKLDVKMHELNTFVGNGEQILESSCGNFLELFRDDICFIIFSSHINDKLKKLIERNNLKNVVFVGVRKLSRDDLLFLSKNSIKNINLNQFVEDMLDVTDYIMEFSLKRNLHLIIDMSCLDSVFVPGAEDLSVGGLNPRELLFILNRMSLMKNLKFLTVFGVNEKVDKLHDYLTIKLQAKILSEFLS